MAESYGFASNFDLFERGFNAAYDDDFYKISQHLYGVDETGQTQLIESGEAASSDLFRDSYRAYQAGGLAGAMERVLMEYESRLSSGPESPRLARYTDNHDEGRGVYRFGDGAVLAMSQLMFMAGHTIPFLLSGQEFGAENRPPIHERILPCDKGRRIRRADGSVLEVEGVEFEGNLFARGARKRKGWYAFYRELIALRKQNPELVDGGFALVEPGEKCPQNQRTVVAFERRLDDQILRCAVNLGPAPRELAHIGLFRKQPLYGGLIHGALAPFTSVVVRST
jgi:glycosidase